MIVGYFVKPDKPVKPVPTLNRIPLSKIRPTGVSVMAFAEPPAVKLAESEYKKAFWNPINCFLAASVLFGKDNCDGGKAIVISAAVSLCV